MADHPIKPIPTCAFEVSTELQPLPDAALGVGGKGLLDVLHADPPGTVSALPEEAIDKNLQNKTHLFKERINKLAKGGQMMFLVTASDFLLENHCFS